MLCSVIVLALAGVCAVVIQSLAWMYPHIAIVGSRQIVRMTKNFVSATRRAVRDLRSRSIIEVLERRNPGRLIFGLLRRPLMRQNTHSPRQF
jgi:hypothetical protein